MNINGGFTRSYRRKWDNPVFVNKQQAAVWAWMCDVAQWQPTVIGTKWGTIELRRGELVIAERVIADDFGMHRNTLRGLLNRMVDEGMIRLIRDRIPHRCGTIVSIVKYAEYQGFNGVHYDHEDHTAENSGPYAGPHEDHTRTENNTVNYQNKDKGGAVCVTPEPPPCAPACEAAHTPAPPDFPPAKNNVVPFAPPDRQPMPPNWLLPEAWRAAAADAGLATPELSALKFRDHWRDKGAVKDEAGWWSAWEWWFRKDIEWERKHGQQRHGGRQKRGDGLVAFAVSECGFGPSDAEGDPDDGGRFLVRG